MNDEESYLSDKDLEYEKEVDEYAKKLIKYVEDKSKMFGITVNQIANEISGRQ